MLTVTPGTGGLKAKLSPFYTDDIVYGGIVNASFVPLSPVNGAASPSYTLVFGTSEFDQEASNKLEAVTAKLYQQTVGKKGSPKGAFKPISLPKRVHQFNTFDQNLYWVDEGAGEFSNVTLDGDGNPVLAVYRGTYIGLKTDSSQRKYDTEFGLYRLDLKKSSATASKWAAAPKLPPAYLYRLNLIGSGAGAYGLALTYFGQNTTIAQFAIE